MTTPDRRATSAEDALALAERAGIHRIALPTPFLVGRINCYLIEDEPLTLIDTGPNSGKSLDDLERALAAHGHRIEDLELILLTHQHMDSMRTTREMPARLTLSGHGNPILEHAELIDERLRIHRRRAARILQILDPRPLTAHEIAIRMWGNVAVTQAYLTLSEVLGHLDLLVQAGQAAERDRDGVAAFETL